MGTLRAKLGVEFGTVLAPAGARILEVLKLLVSAYEFDLTITSARDGTHSGPADPHHTGEAFDIRTRDLTNTQKQQFVSDLIQHLETARFFAFLESPDTPNEHVHVQRRRGTVYSVADYLHNS